MRHFLLLLLLASQLAADPSAPASWCAEAARFIPVQSLTGEVAGRSFVLQSARFDGETLVLEGGAVQVRVWAPWTGLPQGLTFWADASTPLEEAPQIQVTADGASRRFEPPSGYGVRLEFATTVHGQLPVRLNLRLPDGSWLAGEFGAAVAPEP